MCGIRHDDVSRILPVRDRWYQQCRRRLQPSPTRVSLGNAAHRGPLQKENNKTTTKSMALPPMHNNKCGTSTETKRKSSQAKPSQTKPLQRFQTRTRTFLSTIDRNWRILKKTTASHNRSPQCHWMLVPHDVATPSLNLCSSSGLQVWWRAKLSLRQHVPCPCA